MHILHEDNNNGCSHSPLPVPPCTSMGMSLTRQNWHFAFTYFCYTFLFVFFLSLLCCLQPGTIKWEEKLHNNPFEIVGLSLNICVNIVTNAQPPIVRPSALLPPSENGWMMSNRRAPSHSTMSNFVAWLSFFRLQPTTECRDSDRDIERERWEEMRRLRMQQWQLPNGGVLQAYTSLPSPALALHTLRQHFGIV